MGPCLCQTETHCHFVESFVHSPTFAIVMIVLGQISPEAPTLGTLLQTADPLVYGKDNILLSQMMRILVTLAKILYF